MGIGGVLSIGRHTLYNIAGAVLPLGLSLGTIPLYISLIGEARYGVLAIAWLLLGYFGLFDLGLGRATAQRIAALGNADHRQRADTFWTALVMNSGLGAIGGLVIWPVAIYFFGRVISVDAALRNELAAAIPWLIMAVPLATLSGVLTGALQGKARFLELNLISIIGSALVQLVPLAVVSLYGPDLAWLLPSVILARVVTLSVLFWRCRVHVFEGQPRTISRSAAKGLLQFGGWVTVTSVVGPMMVILDRFVIGATLGAKAVTYYTVPFQLAERTAVLSGALSAAIFPRLAAASPTQSRQLSSTAIHSLTVVMTPLVVLAVLMIEPFLQWWLDPDFAARVGVTAQLLVLGFWINAIAGLPYAQLQATGRPDLVAKCHLAELLPYFALLYVGMRFGGLPGAALVFGLRAFVDFILLCYFAGVLKDALTALYVPVLLLLVALGIANGLEAGARTWWLFTGGLVFLSIAWSCKNAPEAVRALTARLIVRKT